MSSKSSVLSLGLYAGMRMMATRATDESKSETMRVQVHILVFGVDDGLPSLHF